MQKATFGRLKLHSSSLPQIAGVVLFGLILAGCSTSGSQPPAGGAPADARVTQAELQAYCPRISLREGTSYFSSYEKGGNEDSTRLIYQASIADVTRDCRRDGGNLTVTLAAAGRVVPGPKFRNGAVTLPIRVAVMQGDKVISSTLHKQAVSMAGDQSAVQFLFSGASVSVPEASARQVEIFIGFDEITKK